PHLEDIWVRSLRPLRTSASLETRQLILKATTAAPGQPLFGEPLQRTRAGAFLTPGTGNRSLATVLLPVKEITFYGCRRAGAEGADLRVELHVGALAGRQLPVKDHHLLSHAEQNSTLGGQVRAMQEAVRQMGEMVAVRLGLSRPWPLTEG